MIKNKKILIITFTIIVSMLLIPNKSKAGLQANKGGTSLVSVTADAFFTGIRKMETQYGTLGKSASLDSKSLDTTQNGIDAHMALNTEWGTVALLTDSVFGVGKGISGSNNSATSTGNESGVYNLANGKIEYVATTYGGTKGSYNRTIGSSDGRYYNNYTSQTSKPGDALNCSNWLDGTGRADWTSYGNIMYFRGYCGLFGFSGSSMGEASNNLGSRAVVVCGSRTLKYT